MWRWLMETETDDGAGSLRESSGGELVHEERSQYSSTIHNARVKLRNGRKRVKTETVPNRTGGRCRLNGMGRNGNGNFFLIDTVP